MNALQNFFNKLIYIGKRPEHDYIEILRLRVFNSAIILLLLLINLYIIPSYLFLELDFKYVIASIAISVVFIAYLILTALSFIRQARHLIIVSILILIVVLNVITSDPLVNMLFPILPIVPACMFLFDKKVARIYQNISLALLFLMVLMNAMIHSQGVDNFYYIACFLFIVCYGGLLVILRFHNLSNDHLLQKLAQSQEITLQSQEMANVGTWQLNFTTRDLQWSDKMYEMFNISKDAKLDFDLHMKAVVPVTFQKILDDITIKEAFNLQYYLIRKGEQRWYRISGKPFTKKNGSTPTFMIGAIQDITEQVRKDKNIEQSNSRLKAALESTGNGIVIIERNTLDVQFNQHIRGMFKIPPAIPNITTPKKVRPYFFDKIKNIDTLLELFEEINLNPHIVITDTLYLTDGRVISMTSMPQKMKEEVIGRVYNLKDITDEYTAEQLLKHREGFYRKILEYSYDGVVIFNEKGIIKYTTSSTTQILGYDVDDVMGNNLLDFVHPEDKKILHNALKELSSQRPEDKIPVSSKFRYLSKDGTYKYVEGVSTNHLDDPIIGGFISNYRDISESVALEKSLIEKEQRYRFIFETSQFGILTIGKDLKFVEANAAICELLDYSKEEFIGLSMEAITHPDDVNKGVDKRKGLVSGATKQFNYVKRYLTKKGKILHSMTKVTGVYDENGNYEGSIVAIVNITDLVEKEQKIEQLVSQLQHSNHELGQFAYAASHDLQEPLRMVGNFVQLLEEEYSEQLDAEGRSYIEYAVSAVRRMSVLIDNLIDYAKIGALNTTLKPLNISNVVNAIREELMPQISRRNAKINILNLPNESVYGDPFQISSVFYSLLENALKFNKSSIPEVTISCQEEERKWHFTISDNGVGIALNNHQKVFEIFKKLHRKEVHKGTGVGLAMTKRIVLYHGGQIWVESAINEGSIFHFTIPKKPII